MTDRRARLQPVLDCAGTISISSAARGASRRASSKSKQIAVLPLVPDAVGCSRRRLSTTRWRGIGVPELAQRHPARRAAHRAMGRDPEAGWHRRADAPRSRAVGLGTTMAAIGAGDRIIAAAQGHVSMTRVRVYAQLAGEAAGDAIAQADGSADSEAAVSRAAARLRRAAKISPARGAQRAAQAPAGTARSAGRPLTS